MIFLTVGTQFPFDRLVRSVDHVFNEGFVGEEIFAQIGESSYKPQNFEYVPFLTRGLFENFLAKASSVISHAGIGTITMALDRNTPVLVMPRLKKYGEVVNDHQLAIARKFEELHHILVAYGTEELPGKIEQLKYFVPRKRETRPEAVAERIDLFLNELGGSCAHEE